jgi:hypothetical protein
MLIIPRSASKNSRDAYETMLGVVYTHPFSPAVGSICPLFRTLPWFSKNNQLPKNSTIVRYVFAQKEDTIEKCSGLFLKLSTKGVASVLKQTLRYARYAVVTLTSIGFAVVLN